MERNAPTVVIASPLQNRATYGTTVAVTTETTVYTAEVPIVQLASVRLTNVSAGPETITLSWVDAAPTTATFELLHDYALAVATAHEVKFEDGFTLRRDDELRITASGEVDVMVTVIEPPGALA